MWEDNSGQMHTGPTTSPENSYTIHNLPAMLNVPNLPQVPNKNRNVKNANSAQQVPPPPVVNQIVNAFLAVSPAIDMSILRQVRSAYSIWHLLYLFSKMINLCLRFVR
jgi:hypothetical protein